MADLTFTTRRDGPVGQLTLIGEARMEHVDGWRTAGNALRADGAKHLLIDVRALTFADSASMGALIHLQNDYATAKGRVILIGPRERMRKMISAMGLSGHIHTAPDEVAARAALIRP